jgi:hypothetical protein
MERTMAKDQTFNQPTRGHVGILAYDPDNDRFQVVHVDSDGQLQVDVAASEALEARLHGYDGADWQKLIVESASNPNLRVRLFGGSTSVNVALASGDDRSPNYGALATLAQLYGYDGSAWDRLRAEDQQLNVNPHGHDGSAWRKQPLIWSFSDTVSELMENYD